MVAEGKAVDMYIVGDSISATNYRLSLRIQILSPLESDVLESSELGVTEMIGNS